MTTFTANAPAPTVFDRVRSLHWGLIALIGAIAAISCVLLYSAGGGSMQPWADKQAGRFAVAFALMLIVALIPVRFWFKQAYGIFVVSLMLLTFVEFFGRQGKGATRWIDI